MWEKRPRKTNVLGWLTAVAVGLAVLLPAAASAITPLPTPAPESGSYGLEATKTQPPPKTGATITTPGNGGNFSTNPVTVSGICPTGLLVEVYDNGAMVGAVNCVNGSYSLQVTLFPGENDLDVIVYDNLNQAGPDSNHITVSYNNANFSAFGQLITLTSNYGRRAADPGATLTWPLLLSGGTGPYAFSIDWGDGTPAELKSQAVAGEVDISHVYSQSGIYHVTVQVTDANGVTAFLQVVAVASGTPSAAGSGNGGSSAAKTSPVTLVKVLWQPMVLCIVLLLPAFWLGRRSELFSLHHMLEKSMHDAMVKETTGGPSGATVENSEKKE